MIRKIYNKYIRSKKESDFSTILNLFIKKHSRYNKSNPIISWDLGGFSAILRKNAIFSKALNIRGFKTRFIICDGVSEACIQRGLEKEEKFEEWKSKCSGCLAAMESVCEKYSLDYSHASTFIDAETKQEFEKISLNTSLDEIIKYKHLGLNIGEFSWSSMNRYMKGFLVDIEQLKKEDEKIYRKYFYAALVNSHIAEVVFKKFNPSGLYTSHGVYTDYSPPIFLGYKKGVHVLTWASGFADFLHYFTAPKDINKLQLRGMSETEWNIRKNKLLTESEKGEIDAYFFDRYYKGKAIDIAIMSKPEDKNTLKKKLAFNNDNPIICLFTHVNWDACFDLGTMIFENANLWVLESIKKMMTVKNVNWIVRVHPGEITDGSLYTTSQLIEKNFPALPENIKVLYHDSDINTYGLYQLVDAGITIFGTVGVELSFLGKPIITAGDAHFSNKGFSIDAKNKEEYFSILENAKNIRPLTGFETDLAKKYAYSYFIQRQIPLNIINKAQGHWGDIDINRLDGLLPGKDKALDKICDGIVNGSDVILD